MVNQKVKNTGSHSKGGGNMNPFKWVWGMITGAAKKFDIEGILKAVFTQSVKLLLGEVWGIVEESCKVIGEEGLKDEKARTTAFDRIKLILETQGISAKDSLVNLAIELVVNHFKDK